MTMEEATGVAALQQQRGSNQDFNDTPANEL
jgi:hypothetical protein